MEPLCGYEVEYSVEEVTGDNALNTLPSFVNFDGDDEIEIFTNDNNEAGEYIIQVTGEIKDGPQVGTQAFFRFTILVDFVVSTCTAPVFVSDLVPLVTATAGQNQFAFDVDIPDTFDADGDNVVMEWDFIGLTGFIEYRESEQKLVRKSGANFDNVPTGNQFI